MLGYEISIRCICGQETRYRLNALRFPLVTIGRKQDEDTTLPDINMCSDDKRTLSRFMLYFAYDLEEKDWVVGAGFPPSKYIKLNPELNDLDERTKSDEKRSKKQDDLFYVSNNKLVDILSSKYDNIGNKVLVCGNEFRNSITPFGKEAIPLQDIAGIGLKPCNIDNPLEYNGQKITCVTHPLIGQLPFGWYIEISANRANNSVVRSFISRSKYFKDNL